MIERTSSLFKKVSAPPETVLPARIQPARVVAVTSDFGGVLTALAVTAGKEVKEGDLLASIRSDELIADNDRAHRRLELAQHRYAFLKSTTGGQPNDRIRDEELGIAKSAVQTTGERVKAYSLSEAEEAYSLAQQRIEDLKDLLQQKLATQYEYDEAVAKSRSELRNLNAAREHLSRLRQESDLANSNLRMLQMRSGTGNPIDVQAAEIEMRDAAAAFAVTQQRLEKCQIRSRISGTVTQVTATQGDTVPAGSPLLQVADLTTMVFEAPVTASIARAVHGGSPVMVRIPSDPPTRVPAKIASVTASPDPARQAYLVRVSVPNPDARTILAGLEGAVEIPHLEYK